LKTQQPPTAENTKGSTHSKKGVLMNKLKRYISVLLFSFLGILILWLITRNQDMGKIWDEFRNAKFFWLFLAFLSGIIANIFRAIRWNILIKPIGETPPVSITFYAQMTGYLANLAVPRLGEITRCATLAKHSKVPFNALAGTVVAERIFDMLCLLVLIFFTIIFQFAFLKGFLDYYIFTPFMNMLSGNIVMMAMVLGGVGLLFALFVYFIRNISYAHNGFAGKLKRQVVGFWKGLISLTQINSKMLFLSLSVLIWTFYFFSVYMVFYALPGTSFLGVADGFTILVMGSLGVVAPVPGGVGTYHFIVIKTMTELLGVGTESATSYAYISHAVQMITVILLGGFSWLMLSLNIKQENIRLEDLKIERIED
jgi:glycosyltransferase 2 family protein